MSNYLFIVYFVGCPENKQDIVSQLVVILMWRVPPVTGKESLLKKSSHKMWVYVHGFNTYLCFYLMDVKDHSLGPVIILIPKSNTLISLQIVYIFRLSLKSIMHA